MAKQNDLASQLRHRITLQRPVHSIGAGGEVDETWEEVASVWAAIEPQAGSEALAAEQLEAVVRSRVTIRYREGIHPQMRMVFNGRIYDIRSVICPEEAREKLILTVEETLLN